MSSKPVKMHWTETSLQAAKLMLLPDWPDQRIHDEADIGEGNIKAAHALLEAGIPFPDETPVPVYKKLPESHDALTESPKTETKKQESIQKAIRFDQSNLLRILPRVFTTSSLTIWLAIKIAEKEWGWHITDPGEFIDRFVPMAMEAYGFPMALYSREPGAETINRGNGKGEPGEKVAGEVAGEVEEEAEAEEVIFTGE